MVIMIICDWLYNNQHQDEMIHDEGNQESTIGYVTVLSMVVDCYDCISIDMIDPSTMLCTSVADVLINTSFTDRWTSISS